MAKISKRVLDKKLENYIFELFIKTLANLRDENEVKDFFEDLLSPTERIMLVKRLAIAILLKKKYTYNQIDRSLKVSRQTIMNVSFWLKNGKSGYEKAVEKILKNQKKENFIDSLEETVLQLSRPKKYGSIGFDKKQNKGKELFRKKQKRNLL
jgi:uncharacterized protein YerC